MRLLLASLVVTFVATAGCAGQIITVGPKGDVDSGGGDDGGPTEDVVVTDVLIPPPFDSGPIFEDSPVVIEDTGSCLVDLEPCIDGQQCCSGVCAGGTCQGPITPPPSCLPDGVACNGSAPCCNGPCINGVCGVTVQDAGPPVTCGAPANNPCFDCLANACCPQLAACQSDTECTQSLACFEGCFTGGNGLSCSQKCDATYPSPFENPLTSCAASLCAPSCQ